MTINYNDKIRIRKYTDKDKTHIINLFRLNTPIYFAPSEEIELIEYLEKHADNHFIIENDSLITGCGGFNFSDDSTTGIICWDIIHPDHQGKGFGSSLTKYRIDKIKQHKTIQIITVRTSQLVFRFYENFGFVVKEIIKDYWAEGFDLYRMELPANSIQSL